MRRVDGGGPVKIGHSRDVERRLANVQEWLPFEVAVLATLPGGAAEEHDIHHAFSAARIRGEWFKATAGLLALVEHAKARGSGERLSFAEIDAFAAIDGNVPKRGAAYERVAAAAARAGVSVSSPELAWKTGLSGTMVGAHALRRRDVLSETVAREIGRVLGVSPRWLRDGAGAMLDGVQP